MSSQTDLLRAVANGGSPQGSNLPTVTHFHPDAWHAMQSRDDQLIRDSILHGYTGKEYVYKFSISGAEVHGVSVVGARELAAQYGGIKSRIVASVDKTGSLFVFKSFEPLAIKAEIIPQLADQEDFYEVVMEVTDIKTGNAVQVRKKETKREFKRDGTPYDRPHYDVIAESKAYRNGVLSIIPQSVIGDFETRALKVGNASAEKTIDQLREGVLSFAARSAIALDRQVVSNLTYAQILGLGNAAKVNAEAFKLSAQALGIVANQQIEDTGGGAGGNVSTIKDKGKGARGKGKGAGQAEPKTRQVIDPDGVVLFETDGAVEVGALGDFKGVPYKVIEVTDTVIKVEYTKPEQKSDSKSKLLDDVKRLIKVALDTKDTETAMVKLDEVRSMIAELNDANRAIAQPFYDGAAEEIKAREQ